MLYKDTLFLRMCFVPLPSITWGIFENQILESCCQNFKLNREWWCLEVAGAFSLHYPHHFSHVSLNKIIRSKITTLTFLQKYEPLENVVIFIEIKETLGKNSVHVNANSLQGPLSGFILPFPSSFNQITESLPPSPIEILDQPV